jgi:lipopolysaccharide export system protein LptA
MNARKLIILLVLGAALAGTTRALAENAPLADAGKLTVITSDKLTFDYTHHFALFDGNVVVVDPQMKLYADKMTVLFSVSNKVSEIKAEGKVFIVQEDKQARSEVAQYNVDQGIIVLTGKPQVTRGQDILTGDKITFWRDQNKMLVDARARLVINPKEGQASELMGDPRGR